MLNPVDASPGDKIYFKERRGSESFTAIFVKAKPNGDLVFDRVDRSGRYYIGRKDYLFMRVKGLAIKRSDETAQPSEDFAVEPAAFEPELPSDSKHVKARKKKYLKATIQHYYVRCMDEYSISASHDKINEFIDNHKEIHERNFGENAKAPGTSTLIRLARECGEKHFRPFNVFLNGSGGDRRSGLWIDFVLAHKRAAEQWYWSPHKPTPQAVKRWFNGEIARERKRRLALSAGDLLGDEMRQLSSPQTGPTAIVPPSEFVPTVEHLLLTGKDETGSFAAPTDQTIQNWIDRQATLENIARREGRQVANRQIEGVHPHVSALRPLECVVMDFTQIDLHTIVLDANGKIVGETFRPYLIVVIDVFSRMVLAATLSIDGPSLETLNAGLKQTLKPKDFLAYLNTDPAFHWAIDGWGLFKRMLVDNDLSNVGRSMRSSASAIGLNVSFAPVRTPQYKAIVERFFQTLNTSLWHEADGGVPEKPGVSKVDPRKTARFTLPQAQRLLWDWIATVYHLDVHSELELPPALVWKSSFETYNRPMADDMNVIENAFGRSETRTMTTSGIEYRNEFFCDPIIVTLFMDELCEHTSRPRGTKKKNNTRKLKIDVTELSDVTAISIYHPKRGQYYRMPNVDATRQGTYDHRVIERAQKNQQIEEFYGRNDLDINKAAIAARLTDKPLPIVDLSVAVDLSRAASSGNDGRSSSREMAAHKRDQVVIQRTGKSRRKARSPKAAPQVDAPRVAVDRTPIIDLRATPNAALSPDPVEAAANVAALAPAPRPPISDGRSILEQMRGEVKISRS